MAKQISSPVPAPAPVTGVQDPAVRRALQDLIDAHNTRNGQTKERFLTEDDIKQLAGMIVYTGLSGEGARGVSGGDFFDNIRKTIEDRVFSTEVWRKVSSDIEWLTAQNSLSLAKIASLGDGFTDERIERLEGDARLLEETRLIKATSGEGASTAAILEERTARTTADTALVSAINTMWASVGVNNALIQDGGNIAVNWNAAQADQWTQIQVEVLGAGGNTIRTALAEEANLRVDLEGNIQNTWTVRMNADGRWAGFGLGMEGTPGAVQSTFIIAADQFAVVTPGEPGAVPHIPFYIGPSDGWMLDAGLEWSFVQGLGRPQDNATYGADATNLQLGVGANLIPNTRFVGGNVLPWVLGWNPDATNITVFATVTEVFGVGSAWELQGHGCIVVRQEGQTATSTNEPTITLDAPLGALPTYVRLNGAFQLDGTQLLNGGI